MTLLTFDIPTLADSQLQGGATVVQAHFTIAINLGSRSDVTVSSPPATPVHGDEEPVTEQIAPGTEPQTGQIADLVSDDDEFTSVPSATAAAPVIGDLGPTSVQTDGAGNGHTTLAG